MAMVMMVVVVVVVGSSAGASDPYPWVGLTPWQGVILLLGGAAELVGMRVWIERACDCACEKTGERVL